MLKIILRILLLIFKKDKYIGEYKNGKKNGQGTFIRKNLFLGNFEYVGEFKDDKMCGKGTLKNYPDNSIYVGEFKDDKRNGQGDFKGLLNSNKITVKKGLLKRV